VAGRLGDAGVQAVSVSSGQLLVLIWKPNSTGIEPTNSIPKPQLHINYVALKPANWQRLRQLIDRSNERTREIAL
jgi:hypothetical protein